MPLFYKKANTVSMVKHGMEVVESATEFLNLDHQIPVITCDQTLFAIAKYLLWNLLKLLNEDRYVIMLGNSAYIEIVLWQCYTQSFWFGR